MFNYGLLFDSSDIDNEIRLQDVGVWVGASSRFNKEALIIKAGLDTCRAIKQGCGLEIVLGKKIISGNSVLAIGAKVNDIKEALSFVVCAVKNDRRYLRLQSILSSKAGVIVVIDDLLRVVHECEVTFGGDEKEVLSFISGNFCFDRSYDEYDFFLEQVRIACRDGVLSDVSILSFELLRPREALPLIDMGEYFESSIFECLRGFVNAAVLKSPGVKIGKKLRELTDVFIVFDDFVVLIEAKSISAENIYLEKTMEKYAGATISHIKKAIRQLGGAKKAFARGEKIFECNSLSEIHIDRSLPVYCVVMVVELVRANDWSDIISRLSASSADLKCVFNVLSFPEFINMLRSSKDSKGLREKLDLHFQENVTKGEVHRRAARPGSDIPYS